MLIGECAALILRRLLHFLNYSSRSLDGCVRLHNSFGSRKQSCEEQGASRAHDTVCNAEHEYRDGIFKLTKGERYKKNLSVWLCRTDVRHPVATMLHL